MDASAAAAGTSTFCGQEPRDSGTVRKLGRIMHAARPCAGVPRRPSEREKAHQEGDAVVAVEQLHQRGGAGKERDVAHEPGVEADGQQQLAPARPRVRHQKRGQELRARTVVCARQGEGALVGKARTKSAHCPEAGQRRDTHNGRQDEADGEVDPGEDEDDAPRRGADLIHLRGAQPAHRGRCAARAVVQPARGSVRERGDSSP